MSANCGSASHVVGELERTAQELARLHSILDEAIAELMANFHRVADASASQRDLVHAILGDATGQATSSSHSSPADEQWRDTATRTTSAISDALNGALTALQFEDIATQLLRHARERVVDLKASLESGDLDAVPERANARVFGPVTQDRLESGSVDLF